MSRKYFPDIECEWESETPEMIEEFNEAVKPLISFLLPEFIQVKK
jgi:hypothetical protein